MTLRIYNTLTRTKEEFQPLDPKNVRMYVCGPTVYDVAHIGNARPAIVFDVMYRLLRHLYGESHVTYVRNITDVDDKINARALRDYPGVELNDAIRRVTETTYDQYQKDVAALGCLPPTHQPRATEHIAGMVEMIRTLIARGHAYEAGGEVLFSVGSMADYGKLSGRKLEDQQAGARVAVDAHKKNPGDFVLWKQSSTEEPGWASPWGRGRPGWHIECSVMSRAHLGEVFDIHGGGLDLIFPHHENEIAQSRCAHGTDTMARYWMHNGFLQVEGKKMSKSDGNFVTIADVLKDWRGEEARLAMLKTHYRQPIDWTVASLQETRRTLLSFQKWYQPSLVSANLLPLPDGFIEALQDDFNIHEAIASLHKTIPKMSKQVNGILIADESSDLAYKQFANAVAFLGFEKLDTYFARGMGNQDEVDRHRQEFDRSRIVRLVEDRLVARHTKNWAESDRIRDKLAALGIEIKDHKDGTTSWEVKR
jgi:cysteinyl-tRNA synthetase